MEVIFDSGAGALVVIGRMGNASRAGCRWVWGRLGMVAWRGTAALNFP